MTFIPNPQARVGSRVRLNSDVETLSGTFTKGTELTIVGESFRGWDLEDDDGNRLYEFGRLIPANWKVLY